MNILRLFQYKYIRNQTGIAVKKVKVNKDSSFVQTWQCPHPKCYIPSPKTIGLLVSEKEILNDTPRNKPWSTQYQGQYFETRISTSKTVSLSFQDSRVSFKDWAYGI